MIKCKLCRMYPRYIDTVNGLLSKGESTRKIAKFLIREYQVPISHMSIQRHSVHLRDPSRLADTKHYQDFHIVVRPFRKKSIKAY